ncbi:MAG: mechanosensitive ion channel family protein [Candidatus Erginobacter occultus]|nr:mechanosensitive ion channel family protein [Candidatus Erginobacter occultus]
MDTEKANVFISWIRDVGPGVVAGIVYALVIFAVGIVVSRLLVGALRRIFARGKLKDETMLIGLVTRTVKGVVMVVAGIMALDQLGVSIAPFVASLGVGSLVLGFAFKDSLSNLASGMLILIYRPFKIGDTIEVSGTMGNVLDLSIVNTTLKDFAGPVIYFPNSQVWGTKITNFSRAEFRRSIFTVGIDYTDDQNGAWDVLQKLINAEERILKDPAPFIRLSELGDSSVNFQMFVYTKPADFGALLNDFYAKAKTALEAAGYSIPFPQRDIHILDGKLDQAG